MIRIENINISYDRTLISQGELEIKQGLLTLIKGESGCGKSSLLAVIGLLTDCQQSFYTFNHHEISNKDSERAVFRKKHIGYVFQDKSLFDHLSIYENLLFYTQMTEKKLTQAEAIQMLDLVKLYKPLNHPITKLSGGEKQRLAIACALCKQPDLLILDEPTSALDIENATVIMSVLRNVAQQGKMVMIASHDTMVIDTCDVIYEIQNKQLVKVKDNSLEFKSVEFSFEKVQLPLKFYFNYCKSFFKNYAFNQCILIVMCALTIALLVSNRTLSDGYAKQQLSGMDQMLGTEIFVTSKAAEKSIALYHSFLPEINEVIYRRINHLDGLKISYPFYEINVKSIDDVTTMQCVIQPYYAEHPIKDYVVKGEKKEQGIYVSSSMNQYYGLECRIEGEMPGGDTYEATLMVDGVLDADYTNPYSSSIYIIYVPYDFLPECTKLQALMVYSIHFDAVETLKQKILEQDSNLGLYSALTHTSEGNISLEKLSSFTTTLSFITFMMTCLFMLLIYHHYIQNRGREIALLRVNGLAKNEVGLLMLVEMVIQSIGMMTCNLMIVQAIYLYIQKIVHLELNVVYSSDLVLSVLYTLLLAVVPTMTSLYFYNKQNLTDALRID